MSDSSVLLLEDVEKSFVHNGAVLPILTGVNFSLQAGEIVALTGVSGTGKTTVLQIMGLLDWQTRGTVTVKGQKFSPPRDGGRGARELRKLRKSKDLLRRDFIGFVYQYHHLLPELTAMENVTLPQLIVGRDAKKAKERSLALLEEMGLAHRCNHTLHKLSGGEQQRVAIARALANNPEIILADEPTGNLDDTTAAQVFSILLGLAKNHNVSMVIATHNTELAKKMSRVVRLHLGKANNARNHTH
jgi:lipoprotein-releasing system ATP-binding protein